MVIIPELEKPENAKWLALLLDTEGALGWRRAKSERDKINGYRYVYHYYTPYLGVDMSEKESKEQLKKRQEC